MLFAIPTTLDIKQVLTFTNLVRMQIGYGTPARAGSAMGILEPLVYTSIEGILSILSYCVGHPNLLLLCH